MNEEKKPSGEVKEEVLTTASLAGVTSCPNSQIAAASGFTPLGGSLAGAATAPALEESAAPLFSPEETKEFRARWDAIQASFVDDPRGVVKQADNHVAVTMKRLAEMFAAERAKLEEQWDRGDNVSTEDLRLALRRYRSFFGRLLSV